MRAGGCRRCRLRSRRPPEVAPPSYGRRAAPFLVCSPLVAAARRLSPPAPWVSRLGCAPQARSPCPPSALRAPPPLRYATLRCPGAVCALAVGGGGCGRSVVGRSAFRSAPSCAGCRSWGGCAAPPPSRPKSLVAPPARLRRVQRARRLNAPPFVAYCGLTAANISLHLGVNAMRRISVKIMLNFNTIVKKFVLLHRIWARPTRHQRAINVQP